MAVFEVSACVCEFPHPIQNSNFFDDVHYYCKKCNPSAPPIPQLNLRSSKNICKTFVKVSYLALVLLLMAIGLFDSFCCFSFDMQ